MDNLDRIIRLEAVLERTSLSRSTLYRKISEGTFPVKFRLALKVRADESPGSIGGSPTQPATPWLTAFVLSYSEFRCPRFEVGD
jgi:hypothetical protein